MPNLIRFENVSKTIQANKVFNGLNFQFSNKIYHLVGDNGAGKTTLLKLIMGLELPTTGKIFLNDELISPKTIANIYYAPDDLQIYDFLTGIEFLHWIAKVRLDVTDNLDELISGFALNDSIHKSFAEMSLGTKKKFVLISVLIGRPAFILFDEPFNGLDAASQEYLRQKIMERRAKQIGIIFTHHSVQQIPFNCEIQKVKISDYKLNFESNKEGVLV